MGLPRPPSFGGNPIFAPPLRLRKPEKRKVFISYHHEGDQASFNLFKNQFSEEYEVFQDESLDTEVDSGDLNYVNRVIREDYIKGSSITIVLCGTETWKRRFIDWEIFSTLHLKHALLGIVIPNTPRTIMGQYRVPDRLHQNIESGYAEFGNWPNAPSDVKRQIEIALGRSKLTTNIRNGDERMKRNLP